jgi:hypothetical protein
MNTYYVSYPRDFANEYEVYVVAPEDVEVFLRAIPDATRISRAEAIRMGWTRPRQAKKYGEQWFGGFAEAHGGDDLAGKIEDAVVATAALVDVRREVERMNVELATA